MKQSTDISVRLRSRLAQYSSEIQSTVKRITDKCSDDLVRGLRTNSPRRTTKTKRGGKGGRRYSAGSYARSWASETTANDFSTYEKTVRNKTHYQLTHLLEFGHRLKNGVGWVKARVHIAPLEKKAELEYQHKIQEEIKKIN